MTKLPNTIKRNMDVKTKKHPKCLGYKNEYTEEFECEYGSKLECSDCKYGHGRKDPEAKCNW